MVMIWLGVPEAGQSRLEKAGVGACLTKTFSYQEVGYNRDLDQGLGFRQTWVSFQLCLVPDT